MSQDTRTIPVLRVVESRIVTPLSRCLEMFLLHHEASHHTPRTLETYGETLSRFLSYLAEQDITTPEDITPSTIREFMVHLEQQGLKDVTVHKHARCARSFLNFLVSEEVLDASPMRKVAMPKLEKRLPDPFSPAEVEALLGACGKDQQGLRDYAMILALLDSGLRASEFISLNVGDVGDDGMVKVKGKGRKERYVRLGARARKAMLRYLATRRDARKGDALWMGRSGRLTRSGAFQAMKRLGKLAGVWPVGLHRFRRTFAIWALRGGMDPLHLKAVMGWSDLQMALVYTRLVKEDIEEAHRQASPVDRFMARKRRKR